MPRQWFRVVLGYPLVSLSVVLYMLMSACIALPPRRFYMAQPPDTPFLRIEAGMHTAPIRRIDVDSQGYFLVSASDDKTARVWSLASGELLKVLRPVIGSGYEGRLYAVAISPEGGTVAMAGWTKAGTDFHNIYLFDHASGRLQRRISGLPSRINHLAYALDGRYMVATLKESKGIRIYETWGYKEIARDSNYGDASEWAGFDRRGRLVTSSYDGYVRLYDAQFKRIAKRKAPVGFNDAAEVNVLSGEDLSFRYAPDTSSVTTVFSLRSPGPAMVSGSMPVEVI